MKKIGIVTIVDNNNYGNRLQNYAMQEKLKKINNYNIETIRNFSQLNNKKKNIIDYLKFLKMIFFMVLNNNLRKKMFENFNNNITFSSKVFSFNPKYKNIFTYNYLIVGSDQVWNPDYRFKDFDIGNFGNNNNKIAYAPSIAKNSFPVNFKKEYIKEQLKEFKSISVREENGKELLENLTNRKDIYVLLDPTMLLDASEWDKVSKKPQQLKNDKYILNYFLGELSEERKKEINRIAEENNCEVINILDKKSPFYQTGPSEFLWLEKNAFLICTDSFHSSVFAILYNRPFIVFDREGNGQGMNSRIETLISKFKLKNREYNGKNITKENLEHDYTEAYKILDEERKKSDNFLRKALDIEEQ